MEIKITKELQNKLPSVCYWFNGNDIYTTINHLNYINGLNIEEFGIIGQEVLDEIQALEKLPVTYKIYDLLYEVPPLDVKQKFPGSIVFPEQLSVNLHKVNKKSYGALVSAHYYKSYDPLLMEAKEPIVKIEYTYNRSPKYLLESKVRTISWMLSDDTWSSQTQVDTLYCTTESEKLIEIKALRSSVVDEAEALAKELKLWPYVKPLFERYIKEINLYKEAGSRLFSDMIRDDVENSAWLDLPTRDGKMTIRAFLMNFFLIGSQN